LCVHSILTPSCSLSSVFIKSFRNQKPG
jgi:hypothetical protein